MKKSKFLNILLTSVMLLSTVLTPQMSHALASMQDATSEVELVDVDTDEEETDTDDGENVGEEPAEDEDRNSAEGSASAEVTNIEGEKETEDTEDETQHEADEETKGDKNETPDNTGPPATYSANLNIAPMADLGNIFTFGSFQKDEQDIENGAEIEFNTQYQLQYAWETVDVDAKAGDTATLQLPDVFEHWTNAPDQEIVAGGTVVGTYSINNGLLTFTFNENIEGASVQNGFVGLNLEFNEDKFLEEWEHEIDFDGDGEKDLTVIVIPGEVETSLDKEGHTDSDKNAREITWVVDFTNGSDKSIIKGILTDTLPDGLGEARDFVVKELSFDFDGNKTVGDEVDFNEPTVNGNEFELTFDNVSARSGYRVEYTTTITDYTISEFTNAATFAYDNETLPADTTVYSRERSNPIQKEGTYNWDTGQIDWTIIVNENGMDIENTIVHDKLPEEQTLVADSIEVTKNWQDTDIEADGFPITLGSVSSDEVYRITFSTDIDWSKVNGGEYQHHNEFFNETELRDGENPIGEDDAKVDHWRSTLIEKSGNANDYNYKDKVLSWKIDVNKAKHPIKDAVLTDTLPVGLGTITFEDITIEGAQVDSEDVTITRNDDGTQTVVITLGDIDDEVTVSYQTEVEDFEKNDFKNEASLGGDGIGVETPKDDATVNPPGNAFSKDFKGIDYSEKTIDWELSVNPQREAITELKIEDTFPNNGMILLPETISVKIGGIELKKGTDYTLKPNTDGGETGYNNGFTIDLINISEDSPLNDVLTVEFKTSYDPQLKVDGNTADGHTGYPTLYTNHADFTGKTVNGNDFDRNDYAETRVREDSWNSGKKEGQLVDFDEDATERKIAWQVYTNYQQQNLGKGISVTDTLDYEGIIDKDSIVVSVYEVDKEGNTNIIKDKTISDYTVEVDGKEFTLSFDEEFEVDERYVIEFTTSVPDISEKSYTNNAMLKVGEREYPYTATVNYDRWDDFLDKEALGYSANDDVFIGEELEWEVTVNESLSIIKDATIKDTISVGLTYVEESLKITTSSDSALVEDTDYTLEVSEDDEGKTVLDIVFKNDVTEALTLNYTTVVTAKDGQPVNNKIELNGIGVENKSKETDNLTAKQFSWVGGDFNPNRGAIRVQKVDSASEEIISTGEATFELFYELNGERVQFGEEFTTKDGVLEIGGLPLRTYYLTEVEAPDGYILSEEEFTIVVDKTFNNNKDNVFEVNVKNVKMVDITVMKDWSDEDDLEGFRPNHIEVELYADGKATGKILNIVADEDGVWEGSFINLPKYRDEKTQIEYSIKEVSLDNSGYSVEVIQNKEDIYDFKLINTRIVERINLEGTKKWDDANNRDGVRPESITVRLFANGKEISNIDVTGDSKEESWPFEFTGLPKYANGEEINYTVEEDSVEEYDTEIAGTTITNSYTPEETDVSITKKWNDEDDLAGFRPDHIEVELYADGKATGKTLNIVADEEGVWKGSFINLPKYRDEGVQINYSVKEISLDEDLYSVEVIPSEEENVADVYDFTLINTHEVDRININGTKTWNDADNQDGVRPDSITVRLLANGEKVYEEDTEVTAETEWAFEFTGLPKYADGEEIDYTIKEVEVDGYEVSYDGFDITNSHTPEVTEVSVTKEWKDEDDLAGFRPDHIEVKLYADGKATGKILNIVADENGVWEGSFINLPKYRDGGHQIDYTVKEVSLDEDLYSVEIVPSEEENDANVYDFTLINTHEVERINLEGTKTWNDADNQDGVRPDSITVRLFANGEEVDVIEVTAGTEWAFEFTNLPKYADGEEINYTIQEDDVKDYSTEIDGLDITNSYTPGQTSINVVKSWDDANDQDGIRSESITVKLFADGKDTGQELVLSAKNNWQADFTELDVYAAGEKIVYTIEEVAVEGYETSISGTSEDGFVITNTHVPEEPETPVDPEDPEKPEEETIGNTDPEDPADSDDDSDLPNAGEAATYTLLALVLVGLGFGLRYYGKRRTN